MTTTNRRSQGRAGPRISVFVAVGIALAIIGVMCYLLIARPMDQRGQSTPATRAAAPALGGFDGRNGGVTGAHGP